MLSIDAILFVCLNYVPVYTIKKLHFAAALEDC